MARFIRGAQLAALAWGLSGPASAGAAYGQDAVTFTEDVAPILAAHCAACHRPGGIGPFSLLDYDAARARAGQIAEATGGRVMPPWKPVAPPGAFEGERRLSDAEIGVIARWAAAGAPQGPPGAPAAPPDATDWQLGPPDLVVPMPEPYVLPAGDADVYRKFVLPVPNGGGALGPRRGDPPPIRVAPSTTRRFASIRPAGPAAETPRIRFPATPASWSSRPSSLPATFSGGLPAGR